ncbi:3-isopropylmalate dehydratase small subunit [Candidatus Peregrinibacteria bacterium]|nr:3-isopropylmalate dehydratase small subunit [Candidatus Peregrinibacteria bacterium]
MEKTAFQKIAESHHLRSLADGSLVLQLDRVWCHEVTTPPAILEGRAEDCDVVFDTNKVFGIIDHVSPAKDTKSAVQHQIMREWVQKHNITFFDVGSNGVCHALIPEQGLIMPGEIGIMGDSHTCTHGAFCAISAGVGTSELGHGIRTGLWICPPQEVIRVNFTGQLPGNVYAKDLILWLINKIGTNGATNAVLEFGGNIIDAMTMEERMTITNMAVEAGATTGMMMVDKTTIDYLWPQISHKFDSKAEALEHFSEFNSDKDARYKNIIEMNVTSMKPAITQGYLPSNVVAVDEMEGAKVNQVFIGSCTNGRLSDLEIAAQIFQKMESRVADGVRCIVVPATQDIWLEAGRLGYLDIFARSGCHVSGPSCAACLGMSCGVLAPGEVAVATTNRNFNGRMGQGGMVHLVSPATAAMTAINGFISKPMSVKPIVVASASKARTTMDKSVPKINYSTLIKKGGGITNFSGSAFTLARADGNPAANVNTDEIIPAKYLTEVEKSALGPHCMEDFEMDSELRKRMLESPILVAGENFGCGSSREHAPWALSEAGIKCVIASSFARIFYNNMFSNGLLCITLNKGEIEKIFNTSFSNDATEIEVDLEKMVIILADGQEIAFELSASQKELINAGGSKNFMFTLANELCARVA